MCCHQRLANRHCKLTPSKDYLTSIETPAHLRSKERSVVFGLPRRRSVEELAMVFLARYCRHCCWHISKLLLSGGSRIVEKGKSNAVIKSQHCDASRAPTACGVAFRRSALSHGNLHVPGCWEDDNDCRVIEKRRAEQDGKQSRGTPTPKTKRKAERVLRALETLLAATDPDPYRRLGLDCSIFHFPAFSPQRVE